MQIDPELIGWISLAILFVLLALGVPVAFSLAVVGLGCYAIVAGIEPTLYLAGIIPYQKIATYSFTVIPLFIIMGHFGHTAGFVNDIFNTARKWLGGLPGGLAQATVAGAAMFGAACGSGMASCAVVGKVTIPEMTKHGVQRKLAFGVVAASGTIAAMIPPSNIMVIYGIITEQSIGKLLIAGIIPGIIAAVIYMIQIFIRVKIKPGLAPPIREKVTWKERIFHLRLIWGIAVIATVVMGGIYTGVFTPTEAGGIGAFSAFMMALLMRRLSWSLVGTVLLETTQTVGMLFLIITGATIFSYFLAITRIPNDISGFLTGLEVNRYWILLGVMLMYLILGTFIDSISAMVLTLPIIFPSILALGFNPIWFGVLVVHMVEVALITPPFALNIFVLKGVIKDSTMGEIIQGIVPFLICDMITLAIYIIFPQVSLWLPSKMD
ncbi:TRAP transporter large permease [Chloroflexota bacterium]